MKRAHPNESLKVDFTLKPISRNLFLPQKSKKVSGNGWENAICDWEFSKLKDFFQTSKTGLNNALIQKIRAHLIISFKENFRKWFHF